MLIAAAQLNPTIGDLGANVDRLLAAHAEARARGAACVVAPELAVTGYPPRDLLDSPEFVRDAVAALARLAREVHGPPLICGAVVASRGEPLHPDGRIANGALLLRDGRVEACYRKALLPTYDVFDETRYFAAGDEPVVVEVGGSRIGLTLCEDIWNDKDYWRVPRYTYDPVSAAVQAGAELVLNLSASPYDRDKFSERLRIITALARRHGRPVLYVNQVGGNDSLIFDGRSLATDARGRVTWQLPAFRELVAYAELTGGRIEGDEASLPATWEMDVIEALTLGLKDYVRKCGFSRVVLGLSGGVDSALTAVLAARALGPEQVIGLAMPSRYSSKGSQDDAQDLARRLGIRLDTIAIEPVFKAYLDQLAPAFAGRRVDVTEENLQARIRGALLMAYSNKLGALLLTTGNKSELAVGYATLYGDMCGGLAVISDVYKTDVYALARHLNASDPAPIPEASLTKPPSAELRPQQTDQDSLPPYADLDAVLAGHIDRSLGVQDLIAAGHAPELVRRVVGMVERAEYKRRQMPPGLKVSRKAFGEGRRLPIAQGYSRRLG